MEGKDSPRASRMAHHVPHVTFFCVFFLCTMLSWKSWSAESTETPEDVTNNGIQTQGTQVIGDRSSPGRVARMRRSQQTETKTEQPAYPLFRSHSPKYYPSKAARTATLLSATLPGLGQAYAGSPGKGFVFLVVEIGLLSAAGFNLDRAVHYDDLADRFATGFYDPYSNDFLTTDQGHVRARSHAIFGAMFLAGGIGGYIWNVLDAAETANQYNKRRFPAQVQQTVNGDTYLTFTHRF